MLFASWQFFLLLAVLLPPYYTLARKFQWQLLLAAGLAFYACSGVFNLAFVFVTALSTYLTALAYEKTGKLGRTALLRACVVLNAGILVFFKFYGHMPLALSFYTFQTLSYLFDVYRGKEPAERNFFKLTLFTSFFPQMIQGPISRFGELKQTLYGGHKFSGDEFSRAALRIAFGFFKKLVVADRLLPAVNALTDGAHSGVYVILAVFLYAVTLYADFTGGIDITIGVARALGVKVRENFDAPFFSTSITDYWRRWHISMGAWFKDYVFNPLSVWKPILKLMKPAKKIFGKHAGRALPVWLSTMATWFLTGLWHGGAWHFMFWGIVNGAIILVSRELTPLYKKFHAKLGKTPLWWRGWQIFRTFWLMSFIRGLDIFGSVTDTFNAYMSMFVPGGFSLAELTLSPQSAIAAAGGVTVMILSHWFKPKTSRNVTIVTCLLVILTIIFGAYGPGYDANQFIYNRF